MELTEVENKIEYVMDMIFNAFNERFMGMTVEEEKETLEYIKRFYPKIDLVEYLEEGVMEMNANEREEEDGV